MKLLSRVGAALTLVVAATLLPTSRAAAAVTPNITGGGCASSATQRGWQVRPCITHHGNTIGYDGYVKVGSTLTACELRLLVIDDNNGTSPYYLNYPCNYGTYLPGGGFIGVKGHCYETELEVDSAELYQWVYSGNDVCV